MGTLSSVGRKENCNGDGDMQTAEQQRHKLRMLEKSFAREMDLEKKLTESRLNEEELKLRLLSSEQMFDKADVLSTEC